MSMKMNNQKATFFDGWKSFFLNFNCFHLPLIRTRICLPPIPSLFLSSLFHMHNENWFFYSPEHVDFMFLSFSPFNTRISVFDDIHMCARTILAEIFILFWCKNLRLFFLNSIFKGKFFKCFLNPILPH